MNDKNAFRKGSGEKYSGFIRYRNTSIIFCIAVIAVFLIFFRGNLSESVYLEAQENGLYLKSYTGLETTIPYSEITTVTLTDSFDPGTMVDGTDNLRVKCGTYKNDSLGTYPLFSIKKAANYIILGTAGGPVVFNYESTDTTAAIYDSMKDMMEKKGLIDQVTFVNETEEEE